MCISLIQVYKQERRNILKKILFLILICISFVFVWTVNASTGEEKNKGLSFEELKSTLLQNNTSLKKLDLSVKQAELQYKKAVDSANNISVMGMNMYINGKSHFISYPASAQYMLKKQQMSIKDQAKYYQDIMGWNRKMTQNSVVNGLWSLYAGMASADLNLEFQQKSLTLKQKFYDGDAIKYDKGIISETELSKSNYNLLLAQNDLKSAQRTDENLTRSLNNLLGASLASQSIRLAIDDDITISDIKLESVDYYINSAEENRMEIMDLQEQIEMKQHEIDIIEEYLVYKNTEQSIARDYGQACRDIENMKLKLENVKLQIEKELKSAYIDVLNAGRDPDMLKKTVVLQQNNLKKLQAQYDAGLISRNSLEQAEIGVLQAENNYKNVCINYKGKVARLLAASEIGPGY